MFGKVAETATRDKRNGKVGEVCSRSFDGMCRKEKARQCHLTSKTILPILILDARALGVVCL
jgi:hypothetical protein